MRNRGRTASIVFCLLLAACSGEPDQGDGKKALKAFFENNGASVAVRQFKKIDGGVSAAADGREIYEMRYSAEVLFNSRGILMISPADVTYLPGSYRTFQAGVNEHAVKPGFVIEYQSTLRFDRAGKGWLLRRP